MGGAVVILVIMEIHTDTDFRHDTDTTEPNAPRLIYLGPVHTKTIVNAIASKRKLFLCV